MSDTGPNIYILGPEDIILQKLRWYRLGGEVSDRQWRDVVSVVRLRRELDLAYRKDTAALVGLSQLLARALSDGGR